MSALHKPAAKLSEGVKMVNLGKELQKRSMMLTEKPMLKTFPVK